MDSYIVRIYRRDSSKSGGGVAGLIEEVGTENRTAFQTISGLITTIRQVIGRDTPHQADVLRLYPESSSENKQVIKLPVAD